MQNPKKDHKHATSKEHFQIPETQGSEEICCEILKDAASFIKPHKQHFLSAKNIFFQHEGNQTEIF